MNLLRYNDYIETATITFKMKPELNMKRNTFISNGYTVKSSAVRAAKANHPEHFASGNIEIVQADAKWVYVVTEEVQENTPKAAGTCKKVWLMADALKEVAEAAGEKLQRKKVIQACIDAGIAEATARTQFQKWFKVQNTQA